MSELSVDVLFFKESGSTQISTYCHTLSLRGALLIAPPPPIVAPAVWLLAGIFTPSATVTPGPKKTLGAIVTSRPSFVSQANQTVSGAISDAPSSIARRRRCACHYPSSPAC